jgi:O-antigen/teichoic acid export membrane protein
MAFRSSAPRTEETAGTMTEPAAPALAEPPASREDESPVWSGLAGAPPGDERSVKSDAAIYTAGVYAAQGIMFFAGLLQKGLLGPAGTGFWALMQTAWTLLAVATLGVNQGTGRQVPLHRGRGDYAGAVATANTGGSFSLVAMSVVGLAVAAVAVLFGGDWAPEIRWGLVILGLIAPLQFVSNFHEGLLQATKHWNVASITEVVKALTALTITTLAVVFLGFYGMFVGAVATHLLLFATWRRMGLVSWRRRGFQWSIDRSRIRELLSYGAPILITAQIWYLFLAIDNLIVAAFLDIDELGYYALAVSVASYLLYLPRSVGAAIFPRMTERYAQSGTVETIRHYTTDTQRLLGYLFIPLFLGAAFFLFPVLIRHGLPEFEPSIPVVRIIVAASFFVALVNMPSKLLITTGLRWQLTSLMLACLVINASLNLVAVAVLDWGLEGAAGATAVSYFITFVAMTGYALSRSLGLRETAGQIGSLCAAFVYTVAALWGIEALAGHGGGDLVADTALGIAKLAVFIVVLTPLFVLVQRRYRVLTTIAGMARSAIRTVRARLAR